MTLQNCLLLLPCFDRQRALLIIVTLGILLSGGCSKKPAGDSTPVAPIANAPEQITVEKSDAAAQTEDFIVVAYNVENLFDVDGIALFDDYKSDKYGARQFLTKIQNITKVMAALQEGRGPEIILFQEFEADQTPSTSPIDYDAILKKYDNMTVESMLTEPLSDEIRDLPAEAFLLKAFAEAGMAPYHVVVAEYRPDPTGRTVAHVNATFSQFPIAQSQTLQSAGARGTLEVVHQIGDHPLYTFNSHWKSGASNPKEEPIRIGNAKVLRDRLTEILQVEPSADIVLGGDFNSQYNQLQRFPQMKRTAINSVLGSQGDELAIQRDGKPDLYNLWYELPPESRRSDAYRGQWGTLMNLMITRGLYDLQGVQYVDNSFEVFAVDNVNAQASTGLPLRWRAINEQGTGFSDHLPILARFRVVNDNDANSYLQLTNPGVEGKSPAETKGVSVDYKIAPASIGKTGELGSDEAIQKLENLGTIYWVSAEVTAEKPLRIKLFNDEFKLWAFDEPLRLKIYDKFPLGAKIEFYGELDFHDGLWQFLVHDERWLDP